MPEFWESAFQQKQEMWGWTPADSAVTTSELFKKHELKKILIPGFGYGRNAGVFLDNGCTVTGIEISKTAIEMAKKHFGKRINIYHGSIGLMPFNGEMYDGIFSYSLLHLLDSTERKKFIDDCYNQLLPGGYMVFVSIAKEDFRYGQGEEISYDTFKMPYGVNLFFYDSDSIERDFGEYGLMTPSLINEPAQDASGGIPKQKFWYIICRKQN